MSTFPADRFPSRDPRGRLLQQLRRQLEQGADNDQIRMTNDERTGLSHSSFVIRHSSLPCFPFSSGAAAIDRLLPSGGLRYGMLVEWVAGENGSGVEEKWSRGVEQKSGSYSTAPLLHYCSTALPLYCSPFTLSLLAAREACREGGVLVVIDRQRTFYPPAAVNWGVNPYRLIVVHPATARDELWAAVQSLRSPAVAAVWMAMGRLDDRAFRRLQLAAQAGRTLGLLVRPPSARGQPSWADVRLEVGTRDWGLGTGESRQFPGPQSPAPGLRRRVRVRVLRCRHGRAGGTALLEIDDAAHAIREVDTNHDAHSLPMVAELANPAAAARSARA